MCFVQLRGAPMQDQSGDGKDRKSEIKRPTDQDNEQPVRDKEISIEQQSSNEPNVEKTVNRQRRAEVQNPLMHESY